MYKYVLYGIVLDCFVFVLYGIALFCIVRY